MIGEAVLTNIGMSLFFFLLLYINVCVYYLKNFSCKTDRYIILDL